MRIAVFLFLALFALAGAVFAEGESPVQYHLSFDNLDFAADDWVQQTGLKTIAERKWELVPGKFGKALSIGAVPLKYDIDNMSGLDLDMVTAVIFNVALMRMKGVGYDEPFIWGAGKLHPAGGSIAFWAKGTYTAENPNLLFEQTTTSWGRKEKELLQVRLLEDGALEAYVEDARYVRHTIRTPQGAWKTGAWNHVAFNWDRSSGLELWVNGKRAASSLGTDAWWENQRPGLFHLPLCQGTYDEFTIFNRPLTEGEIADLYRENRLPTVSASARTYDSAAVQRLKAAFCPNPAALPVLSAASGKTLVFREITPERVQDEGVQGWWISDGRYELAWPHEYSVFTIIPGDVDFHAEKADVLPPAGAAVNYVTFEGNLDGVSLLPGDRSGKFSPSPSLAVPKTKGFFYGALVKGLGDSELRIPFTKSYGTPPGFKSDGDVLRLPLSGDLRLHEFGMFNVSERPPVELPGDARLYLGPSPALDGKRYPAALAALFAGNDRETAGLYRSPAPGGSAAFELKPMTRLNLLSEPAVGKAAWRAVILDLWVKSPAEGNVLTVRLFDPAVPSHTWTHAEARLTGFTAKPGHLRLALEFDPMFLVEGDRVWLQLLASDGLSILADDPARPATVTLRPETNRPAAEPLYVLKTMRPNILTYGRSFEYIPWEWDKSLPGVDAPTSFGGQFDIAYPWQAVLKVDPGNKIAHIYKHFGTGETVNGRWPKDLSKLPERQFSAPANAPKWAVYFRELQTFRGRILDWWRQHQRQDGQIGGGWNDDTLTFTYYFMDLCFDSNPDALTLYRNVFDGFDKTNYFKDGYCRIYPIDRLHNGDFVRERYKWMVMFPGDPRSAVWAMEEARHWGKPDQTPQNYGDGRGFLFGKDILEWYWGKRRVEEPYRLAKPDDITETLRAGAVVNNDTTLWRFTEAWVHADDQSQYGASAMNELLLGGWGSRSANKDTQITLSVGVGWPAGGGPDLGRMVRYSGNDGLEADLYSFDRFDRKVTARLYRLDPGRYRVTLRADRNGDGDFEETVSEKEQALRRFDLLDLIIPPQTPVRLEIKQIQADPRPGDLPDLAVSDYFVEKKGAALTVTVFNIGIAPSGPFTVQVTGPQGNVIGRRQVQSLDGSGDYQPKKVALVFPNLPAHERYTVTVDSEKKVNEIYEGNNMAAWEK